MKFGGFPGGGNMNNMMKQMQKLQKQMENLEEELKNQEVTASSGGGAVEATVNGKKELIRIKIDEAVVDPEDVGMLEDLVLTAVNSAMDEADNIANKRMGKLTGGLNIPGL
ncbi:MULTISPECIES: YbaB/EbfC family nucleoid-associated protein [Peptoniphilus]|uniref:Nucleoid-associated protein HMPREF9225_1808 n=1 Tax=Peptoniphilus duerdenii ATCC BAA-1640 TaxID=862517 RepID=E0NNR9_9FIRM|nr:MULTISPECIES: YbaB/EbfC family nucleoid-associated protein [Peptoniphilus]EFM24572.1 DNA-binding protein, YbaB/EbfC family [Peptoniphilus duerdenii ATCC BAA-1640]ERT62784.1 DNA-binding protein, YbaB/EbfC family [Peptoniphilus sp. BV3AC2]MDK8275870.1 YbaB/EbfC family nucleoid-associated protein [Peptoniphilus duerdenii]